MPQTLRRIYGSGHLHFVTFSCRDRLPLLGSALARNIFVEALDGVRDQYGFNLVGYVVMPEHVHLLIGEPRTGTPSTSMQLLKQRASRLIHKQESTRVAGSRTRPSRKLPAEKNGSLWETRFYDFNVWSRKKKIEKLAYMHMNPVKRGLATRPDDWIWSSYSFYQGKGEGLIRIDPVE